LCCLLYLTSILLKLITPSNTGSLNIRPPSRKLALSKLHHEPPRHHLVVAMGIDHRKLWLTQKTNQFKSLIARSNNFVIVTACQCCCIKSLRHFEHFFQLHCVRFFFASKRIEGGVRIHPILLTKLFFLIWIRFFWFLMSLFRLMSVAFRRVCSRRRRQHRCRQHRCSLSTSSLLSLSLSSSSSSSDSNSKATLVVSTIGAL